MDDKTFVFKVKNDVDDEEEENCVHFQFAK